MQNLKTEHFVDELSELLSSRSYEAFYDRIQEEMPSLNEKEQLCLSLHCADNIASLLGMPGITAESLIRIFYLFPNSALIEDRLFSHLRSTNNFNLLARALQHKIDLQAQTQDKALAYLEFGHFLRFSADDHTEAARSYYTSSTLSIEYALPGIISLQRLNRSDPSCNEAKQAIGRLKSRLNFSEEQITSVQTELNHTSLGDKSRRSSLLLHLATLYLQLWGDANKAIDFIEPALELTADNHAASFAILNDIAQAMPDSLPTLRRISEIFWTYERWGELVRVGDVEWKLISRPKPKTNVLLDLAQVFAEYLDLPAEAARRLYLAYSFFGEYVSQFMSTHGWIFDYALKREGFRQTVLLLVEESGDLNLALKYWDFMSSQQSDRALRDDALFEKWRLESSQAKSSDAFIAMLREGLANLSIQALNRVFTEVSLYFPQIQRNGECIKLLQDLGQRSGRWDLVVASMQTWLSYPLEKGLRIEILKAVAEINERELQDYKQAARACLNILGLEPLNSFALQRIDHIFSASFSQEEDEGKDVGELLESLAQRVRGIGELQDQGAHNMAILQLAGDINSLARRNVDLNDYAQKAQAIFEPLFERYQSLSGGDEFSTKIALQLIKLLQQLQYSPQFAQDFVSQRLEKSHLNIGLLERMVEIIEPMGQNTLLEKALLRCLEEAESAQQSQSYVARLVKINLENKQPEQAVQRLLSGIELQESAESTRAMLDAVFAHPSLMADKGLGFLDALLKAGDNVPSSQMYLSRIADWLYHQVDSSQLIDSFLRFSAQPQRKNDERLVESALLLEKAERFDEAKAIYEQFMLKPDLPESLKVTVYENYANFLLLAYNDVDAASNVFDKILQLYPTEQSTLDDSVVPLQLGSSTSKRFSNHEALSSHLAYCLSLGGQYSLLAKLGLNTSHGKQLRKQANLVKLLIKQSNDEEYQRNLSYLLALLWETGERYDEAIPLYEELQKTKKFELEALLGTLRILRRQKKFVQIPELIEKILQHSSAQLDLSSIIMIYAETLQELKAPPISVFNRLKQAHLMLADDQELANHVQNFAIEHKLYDELIGMLHEDAALALDDEIKAKHFLNIAEIVQTRLHAPMLAFDALCSAYLASPQTHGLLEQIEALASAENNYSELIAFYRSVLNSEKYDELKLSFLIKTADVYATRLNNAINAFETCCDIIRRYPDCLEAVELMENIAQSHARFDLLVSFYSLVPDNILARRSKVERFMNKAKLSLSEGLKIPKGLAHMAMLLVIDPNNNAILHYLNAELQKNPGYWENVTQTMLNLQTFSPSQSALIQTAASIYADRLDNPEKGFNTLVAFLPENMNNLGYFQQATALAERANKHHQLLSIIDDAISIQDSDLDRRNDLLNKKFQIADLIGDDLIKLHTLQDILQENPNDEFAIDQVNSTNISQLKSQARISLLQLQVSIEKDPQESLAKQFQIADYYFLSSQYNNAINLYHSILDEYPDLLRAHYELYTLFLSLDNWKSAENSLLTIISLETEGEKNFQNLVQLASLQDQKLLVPSRALLSLFAALDIYPDFEQLHPQLCALCIKLQSFSPLIDKYLDLAHNNPNYHVKKTALLHAANIYLDYLNEPQHAKEIYEKWMQEGGARDLGYIQYVAKFYKDHSDWQSYLKSLISTLDLCETEHEKAQTLGQIGNVFASQLFDLESASVYMQKAVDLEPENPDLWLEFSKIYQAKDETLNAIEALKHAELYQEPSKKLPTLLALTQKHLDIHMFREAVHYFMEATSLGTSSHESSILADTLIEHAVQQQDLHALSKIWEHYTKTLAPDQKNEQSIQLAQKLSQSFALSQERQALITQILESIQNPDLEQLAQIQELRSMNLSPQQSVDFYQEALSQYPVRDEKRLTLLHALRNAALALDDLLLVKSSSEEILAQSPDDTMVAFDLVQVYYHSGKWDIATQRIEELLLKSQALNYEQTALLHYYYADILYAAQQTDAALKQLNQAVSLMPDFRAAVDLRLTLLLENNEWNLALPEYYTLLSLTNDTEVQGAIHKRIGELYEFYLPETQKAIEAYEMALVLGGDVDEIPMRLLKLYIQFEQWPKAAMTAEAIAEAQTQTEVAKVGYLLMLAEICYGHLDEDQRALQAASEAFNTDPLHPEVLPILLPLLAKLDLPRVDDVAQSLIALHRQSPLSTHTQQQLATFQKLCDELQLSPASLQQIQSITRKPSHRSSASHSRQAPQIINIPLIDIDEAPLPPPPPIASFAINYPDTNPIQELSFSMDDLLRYWHFFEENQLNFGRRIVQDLLAIVDPEAYSPALLRALPESISSLAREKLLEDQFLPAAIHKTVYALATSAHSPALYSDTHPLLPHQPSAYPQLHQHLTHIAHLLDTDSLQVVQPPDKLPNPGIVLNSLPPALIIETSELLKITEIQWITRCAYAGVLAMPTNILFATKSASEIHDLYQLVIATLKMTDTEIKSADPTIQQIKRLLADAKINALTGNLIAREDLTSIRRAALQGRTNAAHVALQLTQSLYSCVEFLCSQNNMWFPRSINTLKSNLKRNPELHELLLYALSKPAQLTAQSLFFAHNS